MPTDCYLVEGGHALRGNLVPAGSKNAALPQLAASLLSDRTVCIENLPRIRDVRTMIAILESLGTEVEQPSEQSVRLTSALPDPDGLDSGICRKVRSSILLAGPLLARCGRLELPPPGGDVIGKRRLDTHFLALESLGAEVEFDGRNISLSTSVLKGCSIHLDEPSVTATENAMMAASVAEGESVIYNAACEPNVQDLARMLNRMGASVRGAGTNRLEIEGRGGLLEPAEHRVAPDHIEIGSFVGLAACCGGEVRIEGVPEGIVHPTLRTFQRFGVRTVFEGDALIVPAGQELVVRSDRSGAIPTIYDGPWPGFSPDLTSTAVVLATQARGTSLIFEKMFESRLFFVDKLVAMGGRIIQCDPHRVVVSGPSTLRGTEVFSPDIRAGMALLTAALCAEGTSLIRNVHQIERGYQNLVDRLRALGAEISSGPPLRWDHT
ncbi:UDP-N-acetylglucosamine 1-carboxyvinyltransferase [Candidatus Fermentibacteria bacterium]|nr:UDP-N-acetylglucosamine 1-carboxyvinyltransferase [Candidatus Fermentibacteria bacterium]